MGAVRPETVKEEGARGAFLAAAQPPLWKMAALALFPLVVLGAIVALFLTQGSLLVGTSPVPPDALLKVDFERVIFRPREIVVKVRNTGPAPVTVAQVFVDDAIWRFAIAPNPTIPRLGSATVSIPYDWVPTEPIEIKLIASNGLVFSKKVDIPVETPVPGWAYAGTFALLGVYVGVIPVYLGLFWRPWLRNLSGRWVEFFVSLTAGILFFLGVDVTKEGLEAALGVPEVFRGVGVFSTAVILGLLGLWALERWALGERGREEELRKLVLAYLIAVGIGLHNLGEGLAIGAAYVLGEVALGALLVVGFTVHNVTEGLAILGPLSRQGVALRHFAWMGLLAGAPTVAGTLIGGFTYYAVVAAFFFGVGAGAIFYVVYQLVRDLGGREATAAGSARLAGAFLLGLAVMYVTSLFVVGT